MVGTTWRCETLVASARVESEEGAGYGFHRHCTRCRAAVRKDLPDGVVARLVLTPERFCVPGEGRGGARGAAADLLGVRGAGQPPGLGARRGGGAGGGLPGLFGGGRAAR